MIQQAARKKVLTLFRLPRYGIKINVVSRCDTVYTSNRWMKKKERIRSAPRISHTQLNRNELNPIACIQNVIDVRYQSARVYTISFYTTFTKVCNFKTGEPLSTCGLIYKIFSIEFIKQIAKIDRNTFSNRNFIKTCNFIEIISESINLL